MLFGFPGGGWDGGLGPSKEKWRKRTVCDKTSMITTEHKYDCSCGFCYLFWRAKDDSLYHARFKTQFLLAPFLHHWNKTILHMEREVLFSSYCSLFNFKHFGVSVMFYSSMLRLSWIHACSSRGGLSTFGIIGMPSVLDAMKMELDFEESGSNMFV